MFPKCSDVRLNQEKTTSFPLPSSIFSPHRQIDELTSQLDYERIKRERLEAQLDEYRREIVHLNAQLEALAPYRQQHSDVSMARFVGDVLFLSVSSCAFYMEQLLLCETCVS